jgi:ATP-dependent DNA helicase RecQ
VAEVLPSGEIRATTDDCDPAAVAAEAVEQQEARRAYERSRLDMLRAYAELRDCRRGFLLNYFGEPFEGPCGACDMCDAGVAAAEGDEPFALGTRVRHDEWSEGTVQRYEADRVVVLFDDAGYRTLDVALVRERGLLQPL